MSGAHRTLGFSFGWDTELPEVDAYLARVYRHLAVPGAAAHRYHLRRNADVDGGYIIDLDGKQIFHSTTETIVLSYLLWHINREAIASCPDHLLLHASAATCDGGAVVLPARMESGKTTLVAGLVQAGFGYLTDEAAAIHPVTGWVTPYPKPLSVDEGSFGVLAALEPDVPEAMRPWLSQQWHVGPTEIRADAVSEAAEPRWVVTPRYVAGATTKIEPLGRAEAVLVMAENSFNLADLGVDGFFAAVELAARCDCHRLTVGDLDDAVDVMRDLTLTARGDSGVVEHHRAGADVGSGSFVPADDSRPIDPGAVIGRNPDVSWSCIDGEVVVFDASGELHHLNAAASATWSALSGLVPLTAVAESLADRFDAPVATIIVDVVGLAGTLVERGIATPGHPG